MNEKKPTDIPHTQPSLGELSGKKALDEIIQPGYKFSHFEVLDPRLQRLLFEELQSEVQRLRQIEGSWRSMNENCPQLDLELLQTPEPATLGSQSEEGKMDSEQIRGIERILIARRRTNPDFLDKHDWEIIYFSDIWSYSIEEPKSSTPSKYHWQGFQLSLGSSDKRLKWDPLGNVEEYPLSALARRISSQLLLYRIISIFDMPVTREDFEQYSSNWEVLLVHHQGVGVITLRDDKGYPAVSFHGKTEASSNDALELLNFLCGKRCKHPLGMASGTRMPIGYLD